jgi:uncharacterized protein
VPAVEPVRVDPPPLAGRVVAGQTWRDVAFLHWRVPAAAVAPLLPPGVRPDRFDARDEADDTTWAGLIAFRLGGASLLGSPPIPHLGTFTEVNVRLYGVDALGRRGVVFRSLEASRLAAVAAANAAFSLPYRWARTTQRDLGGRHAYASRRILGPGLRGRGRMRLAVAPDASRRVDDDLSAFLTARWALFTRRFGRTLLLPNTHEPWTLHPARVDHLDEDLLELAGLPAGISATPPESVLFSPGVDARFGPPLRLPR